MANKIIAMVGYWARCTDTWQRMRFPKISIGEKTRILLIHILTIFV